MGKLLNCGVRFNCNLRRTDRLVGIGSERRIYNCEEAVIIKDCTGAQSCNRKPEIELELP